MAVASAGPYASLHLAPDRQPRQHPTTQFFLQAGCPSCRPTNSVKALTGKNNCEVIYFVLCPVEHGSLTRVGQSTDQQEGTRLKLH